MKEEYNPQKIEEKWQEIWNKKQVFRSEGSSDKKKFYCLEMYPYPSGRIHMGHVRNYAIGDVISRFKRMNGLDVIHPIGWDALGMPAENAAIREGIHPQKWTMDNISHMKAQLRSLGFSYDWEREVNTCLPDYYKWNQWIFLRMLERGLAYRKKRWVNWCPKCQTTLANEQVVTGKCWRCDAEVELRDMEQWFLKITEYAQELISGHDKLEKWPEHVLVMQKNWIGKSTGAYVSFPVCGSSESIDVFTTRVDTIYGATFLALSPAHPMSLPLTAGAEDEGQLHDWIQKRIKEQQIRRDPAEVEKQGVDTGKKAVNPYTGEEIPIWIANYILMEYGTGAVMAVPAHDQRDFEFAHTYGLPIRIVISPEGASPEGEPEEAFEGKGILVNSDQFSGLASDKAMEEMAGFAEEKNFGKKSTLFRLRDWGISRQRYWGTPIPVIYCQKCGIVGVPDEDLPVTLPSKVEFTGEEGSPLEKAESFVNTTCPRCQEPARRETDTMDTFVDSSWYYFRYCSPREEKKPFRPEDADYWMPVDLYIGGVEHAIMHLIYARFFCRVLRDLGLSGTDEPFPHYLAQGMVTKDGVAMSKSKGNVVDPDDMVQQYGADTLRLFILFASPPDKEFAWNEKGIEGSFRFLNRIWSFYLENLGLFDSKDFPQKNNEGTNPSVLRVMTKMHQTIKKVTDDIGKRYHLNTAISFIMEFFNMIKAEKGILYQDGNGRHVMRESMEALLLLLSPFAPHVCEELWQRIGKKEILIRTPWPEFDSDMATEERVTIVVQINGKLRDKFEMERGLPENRVKEMALDLERIKLMIGEKNAKKIIYVKDKLVNIVL